MILRPGCFSEKPQVRGGPDKQPQLHQHRRKWLVQLASVGAQFENHCSVAHASYRDMRGLAACASVSTHLVFLFKKKQQTVEQPELVKMRG